MTFTVKIGGKKKQTSCDFKRKMIEEFKKREDAFRKSLEDEYKKREDEYKKREDEYKRKIKKLKSHKKQHMKNAVNYYIEYMIEKESK